MRTEESSLQKKKSDHMIIMSQEDKFKRPMAITLILGIIIIDENTQKTSDILDRPKLYHLYMYSGIIRIAYDFHRISDENSFLYL